MFRIFPQNMKIPFMSMRVPFGILSLVAVILSLFLLATKGLNYGVDFAGGIQMVLKFPDDSSVNAEMLREELAENEISGVTVQSFGREEENANEFIIHFAGEFADEERLVEQLQSSFISAGTGNVEISEFRLSGLEKAYFRLSQNLAIEQVRDVVQQTNWGLLEVASVVPSNRESVIEYEIQFRNLTDKIVSQLKERFVSGDSEIVVQKVDFVGAKVGSDLKTSALLSLIIATFCIFVYIFLRFDFAYTPGVVLSLVHDVVITAGIFSLLGIEFDLTVVAALLTLAGYTINDTIVVFDRIREMRASLKGKDFQEIIDIALNQTLDRTVITGGTTLMTTGILWAIGGPVIHSFAFALSVGVIIGTYSSIFIAASLVLWTERYQRRRSQVQKKRVAA